MKMKWIAAALFFLILTGGAAWAVNGDNLIAIGPVSRAMGGVGIAKPQDAISAIFANPAALCLNNFCSTSRTDFAGTLFMPDVSTSVTTPAGTIKADSDDKVFAIPAIGITSPIGAAGTPWRFGLAAYGVSGLGVDYRETAVDKNNVFGPGAPLVAGTYTSLQIMKFAPSVAYEASKNFSLGAALHIDYASLDLAEGGSPAYAFGGQVGAIYAPLDGLSLGLTYTTPQKADHEKVSNFDGQGKMDDLELESPMQAGLGVAWNPADSLLLEADLKWINWSGAAGYEDFDWDDQWVAGLGIQYKPVPSVALRAGYNYGVNPVKEHQGFNGTGAATTRVQGVDIPTYYYETFRIVGFPAIVQHHVTLGLGWDVSERFSLNLGYVHGFEETITEEGTDFMGQPVTLSSSLSINTIDFGMSWKF